MAQRIGLIIFGLCVAILFAEILLRVFPLPNRFELLQRLEGLWEPDDQLQLRLKPDLDVLVSGHPEFSFRVQTNEWGLRDGELNPPVPIAAIGDSFTFGFGVEAQDSWPEQLEDLANLEVANLGWAGWNPYTYPAAVSRFAIPLESEVWIWQFYANDLPESSGSRDFFASGVENYLQWSPDTSLSLTELTFPFNLRVVQAAAVLSNPELLYLPGSGEGVYKGDLFEMRYSSYAWDVTNPENPAVQAGWEITESALLETRMMANEHGAHVLVVFVPNREHVYWDYLEPYMPGFDVLQLDAVEARLEATCRSLGIDFLSLLPAFRDAAGEGRMLYFPADGHWSAEGHAFAAEVIYTYLVENDIIEKR